MSSILDHPAIGKIQGKQGQGVVQYFGVKYGHLKDRFATAELPARHNCRCDEACVSTVNTALSTADHLVAPLCSIPRTLSTTRMG